MKNDTVFEEEFTLLEKTILVLLYLKEKSPIFGKLRLQKMIFLISQDFEKLRDELDFEPHRYGMYDQTIDDMVEGLELDGFVTVDENNNKITLTQKGIEKAKEILKEFSEKEIETIEEVKELFEDLTEDEILALLYFKFPEFAKYSEKLGEITRKRKELAISLYKKGKVSLEAASEIAGMNVKEFMKLLKERNLL
jgi:uncharacterized protein YwgA